MDREDVRKYVQDTLKVIPGTGISEILAKRDQGQSIYV